MPFDANKNMITDAFRNSFKIAAQQEDSRLQGAVKDIGKVVNGSLRPAVTRSRLGICTRKIARLRCGFGQATDELTTANAFTGASVASERVKTSPERSGTLWHQKTKKNALSASERRLRGIQKR